MEKLYYRERNKTEHESYIKEIIEYSGKEAFILEETIFFPGGGGQACDLGMISYLDKTGKKKNVRVVDAYQNEKKEVIHILEKSVLDIDMSQKVRISIDKERRDDYMCQHTAQHILSGCFYKIFKRNTKGLHIGKDISQLDIEGEFDDCMVRKIEEMANNIICSRIDIKNYVLTPEEMRNFKTRRSLPKTNEDIRILEITDLDINACCGLHALNTSDIRLIKIKKYYKHKGDTRFEYLSGSRAIKFILNREMVFDRILSFFNCDEYNIENAIDNLNSKKDEFYNKNKYIIQKYVEIYSKKLINESKVNKDGIKIIRKIFDNEEKWLSSEVSKYISEKEKAILLIGNKGFGSSSIQLQCSKSLTKEFSYIDLGKDLKIYSEKFKIKGGGSKFMAQGICQDEKNIDIFLDNIYHIYIEK